MIEFQGKMSGKTLKFFAQRNKKIFIFGSILASIFLLLLYSWHIDLILGIFLFCDLLIPLAICICPTKAFEALAPIRIYIDLEERTITAEFVGAPETFRMIDDVVKVKDHGEFYTFEFNSIRNYMNFVVQKDLIAQGTIEEFEYIFEEVLIRTKNK